MKIIFHCSIIGSGREWDLSRKNGGLNIFPPFAQKNTGIYSGKVGMIASVLGFLKSQKEKYVIMSDANIAFNFDFKALLKAHIESGADVTAVYTKKNCRQAYASPTICAKQCIIHWILQIIV